MHHITPSHMRGISLGIFYREAFDSREFVLLSSPTPGGTVNFSDHFIPLVGLESYSWGKSMKKQG